MCRTRMMDSTEDKGLTDLSSSRCWLVLPPLLLTPVGRLGQPLVTDLDQRKQ